MTEEKKLFHVFDEQTIHEFRELIISISKEMNVDNQTWYTVAEAAEYLRCSDRTIRRAVQVGGLRCEQLRTGGTRGSLRFHRRWLDAYMLGLNARRMSPVQKRLLDELYT